MPWFGDFGMLYYRTDLLEKYGYNSPPKTWDELEQMARAVMQGERANRQDFTGFVFQGAAYEGLTCNALEWLASAGGGDIVTPEGEVTVNNPEAIQMLRRAQGWVGTISPRGVRTYQEEDARNIFQRATHSSCVTGRTLMRRPRRATPLSRASSTSHPSRLIRVRTRWARSAAGNWVSRSTPMPRHTSQ
ncbi:MAG: extracellular solute-binding protein [Chloroflexota bacterium]|nr:extracellular solute-binding protein [Chloroflexota bacterium]